MTMLPAPRWVAAVALAFGIAAASAASAGAAAQGTPALMSAIYSPAEVLVDDSAQSRRLGDWAGRSVIVTMEYSDCRFLCSLTLRRLQEVQAEADRQHKNYEFVVVSLDPAKDTPDAWTRYRRARGLNRPNWHFLTASAADTPRIARRLGVRYWLYDEHIMHDFRLLRLDDRGNVASVMEHFDDSAARFLE